MKKFSHIFLSLLIVFSTTTSAYASSSWAMQSMIYANSSVIINAAKTGFRSTITHLPSAAAVGRTIVAGAGIAAFGYAASQLLGAGIDWVMTEGGDIKYTAPAGAVDASGLDAECRRIAIQSYGTDENASFSRFNPNTTSSIACNTKYGEIGWFPAPTAPAEEKTIPLSTVAAKVISNAAAGHAPSQDAVKAAAASDFNSGALDTKLQETAVPSDAPYDPADNVTPFDPSSIISALQSLMSAITNMSSSLKAKLESMTTILSNKFDEVINGQKETNRVINDGMADVVAANNATGARVGDVVAAIEALEGNMLTGEVINDAIDKAIAAGHTDTASIVAAIEAIEGNTLDGQVINDAVDRVLTNDDANAKATQDVVSDSIDKAIEAGQADATKVADAVDAQTDAITTTDPTTGQKSLSLPSFCSWAGPVCTFIDWSKNQWLEFTLTFTALKDWLFEDAPADDKDNTIDTIVPPVTPVQVAINFVGSCPSPLTFEYKIYNQTFKPSVPFTPMCEVAIMINPVIKICATIAAIFIIAGIRQGNS